MATPVEEVQNRIDLASARMSDLLNTLQPQYQQVIDNDKTGELDPYAQDAKWKYTHFKDRVEPTLSKYYHHNFLREWKIQHISFLDDDVRLQADSQLLILLRKHATWIFLTSYIKTRTSWTPGKVELFYRLEYVWKHLDDLFPRICEWPSDDELKCDPEDNEPTDEEIDLWE
ncbi:MAG: hypothetical protein Q9222_001720 [Ikaeria aurantiellina]